MTAEQLEELLGKVTQNKWFRVRQSVYTFDLKKYENNGLVDIAQCEAKEDATLISLAPSLARKVIAAEKLLDDVEAVMHGLIGNSSWSSYEVNKLLSEITAYREASE